MCETKLGLIFPVDWWLSEKKKGTVRTWEFENRVNLLHYVIKAFWDCKLTFYGLIFYCVKYCSTYFSLFLSPGIGWAQTLFVTDIPIGSDIENGFLEIVYREYLGPVQDCLPIIVIALCKLCVLK